MNLHNVHEISWRLCNEMEEITGREFETALVTRPDKRYAIEIELMKRGCQLGLDARTVQDEYEILHALREMVEAQRAKRDRLKNERDRMRARLAPLHIKAQRGTDK